MIVDNSKLAFSSLFRYEHVAIKGSTPFTAGFFSTFTITHNLGYKPYFKAWYSYGDGKYFKLFAGTASFDIDGNGAQIDNVNVTSSSLIISIDGPATGTIYYRIYAEPQA